MAPLISYLINKKYMRSVAYQQGEIFEAARTLARTEGLIAAPETAHALKCAIDEALACKKTGKAKTIAFNGSGHGLLDLSAYEMFLSGKLSEYEPATIEVPKYFA
jgi:tryptophan synthase beta chain